MFAIRKGDWKLIYEFESEKLSLFNLKEDIGETTNLSNKFPEKTKLLCAKLKYWQSVVNVVMLNPNPEYVNLNKSYIMKTIVSVLFISIVFISCTQQSETMVNMIPQKPATAANYWCTWYAQNYWVQRGGEISDLNKITNPAAREELTYNHLFNPEEGWVTNYLPRGRSDWYFLIDHGWQTKEPSERTVSGAKPFFSLQIDPRDFPEYGDAEPQESLRLFNEEIISNGWRGLGIWTRGTIDSTTAHTFVEWSKYAGIEYWKIDGGGTENFWSFKIKEKIFPELNLEYVTPAGNLNPDWDVPNRKEYPSVYDAGGAKQEEMLRVLQYSDAFRTYDASPLLMSVTTLRRTHDILKQTQNQPKYRSILNLQDDCNAAAALGCLVASKRHPNYMERTLEGKDLHHQLSGKRHMQGRMNEAERFGRWSRIAPAFPAGEGTYNSSEKELIDYCEFTKWDTWNKATYGKMVYQSAPAIMARNMPLPEVEIDGEPPYVMATTYPNGAVCIATEGRVRPDDNWFHPRAKVTIKIKDVTQPIGIFGHYNMLIIEFPETISPENIWAQDLLADSATDIKPKVKIEGNSIYIPGELIDKIGISAGDKDDISAPGMVIKLNI
ncbi:hypothetical protein [Maribellus maritimus]|uniref:hypothetical protein n=1 Tax=Maribellus maritimus TaxID=2870838 RepID=UPI001EEBA46A|nr:hypothetical protein [Maribellus maritimus]MCG6189376.1 hypothetical protein [Maribellus maritimus]